MAGAHRSSPRTRGLEGAHAQKRAWGDGDGDSKVKARSGFTPLYLGKRESQIKPFSLFPSAKKYAHTFFVHKGTSPNTFFRELRFNENEFPPLFLFFFDLL